MLLRDFGEGADRYVALGAIVEFVRFPTVVAKFLGEQVSVLGGFDEWIAVVFLLAPE